MPKPMLSVDDLITHMQSKGIEFTIMSVDDAKMYLNKNNNYFKLTSYRKNYTKYTAGVNAEKYEKLEFVYLVELARIDVQLRVAQKIGWMLPVDIQALDRVRQIRNAAAHNNCIINDLSAVYDNKKPDCNEPVHITKFVRQSGVSRSAMQKKLSNRRLSQIIHLLYAYDMVVKSSNSRQARLSELKAFVNTRLIQHKGYFLTNKLISSTFDMLTKVVNSIN